MSLNLKAERDKEDMIENVRAVLGDNITEEDIPAIWRSEREDTEDKEQEMAQEMGECSADYPIGGMIEPVDIEEEKGLVNELCDLAEENANMSRELLGL